MVFANKKYPVNIKGTKSFIYPANSLSLGDNILMTAISQAYLRDNPDEGVSLVPFSHDIVELAREEKPGKVFLRSDASCVTDEDVAELEELTEVYKFELHREAHELWKMGIYPTFEGNSDRNGNDDLGKSQLNHWAWNFEQKYVIFHIRNVSKIKSKNTDPELVKKIFDELLYWFKDSYRFVVLVGNDESYGRDTEYLRCDRVVDFRKKLTLNNIHKVIENSKLFIGSDSGIAHLAGCCGVPMVCWGFKDECWFPKARNIDQCLFITREESSTGKILEGITERLVGLWI